MLFSSILFSLDFVSFTIGRPTLGVCADTFTVGGSTSVVPTICGENTGQHSKRRENPNSLSRAGHRLTIEI